MMYRSQPPGGSERSRYLCGYLVFVFMEEEDGHFSKTKSNIKVIQI